MKNRIAALSLTLALSVGLCVPAHAADTPFSDVPANHWAAPSIARMADRGVMQGVGEGQFAPDATITYAEFYAMLIRRFMPERLASSEAAEWYAPYVAVAKYAGLTKHTDMSRNAELALPPDAVINRYDMAAVIANILSYEQVFVDTANSYEKVFAPDYSESDWNYHKVEASYQTGILTGVDAAGTFNGNGTVTRAQAAAVMDRLIDYVAAHSPAVASVPGEIPDGALLISEESQLINSSGATICNGGFYLDPDTVFMGNGAICFASKDYTSITFTLKAADRDATVRYLVEDANAGYVDPSVLRETVTVKAGETQTFTFDCASSKSVTLSVIDADKGIGNFAEGWITNLYLLP